MLIERVSVRVPRHCILQHWDPVSTRLCVADLPVTRNRTMRWALPWSAASTQCSSSRNNVATMLRQESTSCCTRWPHLVYEYPENGEAGRVEIYYKEAISVIYALLKEGLALSYQEVKQEMTDGPATKIEVAEEEQLWTVSYDVQL